MWPSTRSNHLWHILLIVLGTFSALAAGAADLPVLPSPTALPPSVEKLRTIELSVAFEKASLADVLKFLQAEGVRLDPDHKGVSFVLKLPKDAAPPKPVSLTVNKLPLGRVLHYCLFLADSRLQFTAETDVVAITYKAEEPMITRTFLLSKAFIGEPAWEKGDVRKQLEPRGIRFPPGASAIYSPEERKLTITNEPDQLELFEELSNPPPVQIRTPRGTKFVEPEPQRMDPESIQGAPIKAKPDLY